MSKISRTTTRALAKSFLTRADAPIAGFTVGRVLILWDDKSKRQAMTTISTDEVLGKEETQ